MNGVTQREWSFLLLLWGLSDPRIAELRKMPQSFIIKLYSETQVSGRLGMSGGISPRHAQNPLSGERRKTLSITHHALSPPPSHHHLYIIHLINWLQRFYRIIMSLKRPFVPKSDVKQWFTTTTTTLHFLFFLHLLLFLFRFSPPSTPLPSILFPLVYIILLLFFFLFLRPFLWLIGLHSLSLHRRSWLCEHGGHFRFWQRKITMNGSITFSVAAPTLELSSLCN